MPIKYNKIDRKIYIDKLYKEVKKNEGNVPVMYPDTKDGRGSFSIGITPVIKRKGANGKIENVIDRSKVELLEKEIGKAQGNLDFKFSKEQISKLEENARILNMDISEAEKKELNRKLFLKNPEGEHDDPENSSFGLNLDHAQSESVSKAFLERDEEKFDQYMKDTGQEIPLSKERVALRSIYHHSPSLIGDKTKEALKNGDREAVYKEISEGMDEERFPRRRAAEAEMFGKENPKIEEFKDNEPSNEDKTSSNSEGSGYTDNLKSAAGKTLDATMSIATELSKEALGQMAETPEKQQTQNNVKNAIGRALMDLNDQFDNKVAIYENPTALNDKFLQGEHIDNEMVFKDIHKQIQGEMEGMKRAGNSEDAGETIKRAVMQNLSKIKFSPKNNIMPENDMFKDNLTASNEDISKENQRRGEDLFATRVTRTPSIMEQPSTGTKPLESMREETSPFAWLEKNRKVHS